MTVKNLFKFLSICLLLGVSVGVGFESIIHMRETWMTETCRNAGIDYCTSICKAYRCSAIAECSEKWMNEVVDYSDDSELCKGCSELVEAYQDYALDDLEILNKTLSEMCLQIPEGYQRRCLNLVDEKIETIFEIIEHGVDPELICTKLRLCESTFVIKSKEDEACEGCIDLINGLEQRVLDADETMNKTLQAQCEKMHESFLREQCQEFVNNFVEQLESIFMEHGNAEQVCGMIGMCRERSYNSVCDDCQLLFQKTPADDSTDNFIYRLESMCMLHQNQMNFTNCLVGLQIIENIANPLMLRDYMTDYEMCEAMKMCSPRRVLIDLL